MPKGRRRRKLRVARGIKRAFGTLKDPKLHENVGKAATIAGATAAAGAALSRTQAGQFAMQKWRDRNLVSVQTGVYDEGVDGPRIEVGGLGSSMEEYHEPLALEYMPNLAGVQSASITQLPSLTGVKGKLPDTLFNIG